MNRVLHIVVHGRVQGVGYRAFVERAALERGVQGWVRNCRDGTVEAVLSGPPEALDAMIEDCRRGPMFGRVDAIDQREGTAADLKPRRAGELFSVLPTV